MNDHNRNVYGWWLYGAIVVERLIFKRKVILETDSLTFLINQA